MTGFRSRSQGPTGTPKAFVIAWQARQASSQRAEMIEATLRRYEVPSLIDIAKRDGTVDQLSRMLDI